MALNVISNFGANVALRNLTATDNQATRSIAKLSAGSRVLAARDDAAALAIGSGLRAEVASLNQARVNAGQAASLLQIAEGALSTVTDILVRLKSLSVQSASGQLSDTERATLDAEFVALRTEIDRIADDTEFNGSTLVNGTTASTTATVDSLAGQKIGVAEGVQSIVFDDQTDEVFELTFAQATDALTLTDTVTSAIETVGIGSTVITTTQTVRFETSGATITLNSTFDKTADIVQDASTATIGAGGTGAISNATINITDAFGDISTIDASTVAFTPTAGIIAAETLTLSAASGGNFVGTVDLTSLGTKTVTLTQGTGANAPTLTIEFVVTTVFDGAETASTIDLQQLENLVSSFQDTTNTSDFTFKLGTATAAQDDLTLTLDSVTTIALGISTSTIDTAANANLSVTAVDLAIDTVNTARANVGAGQNRLEFASSNLQVTIENSEAARSELLDLDVAAEITNFTSKQVLLQAGISVLGQANQLPQNLLRLFQ